MAAPGNYVKALQLVNDYAFINYYARAAYIGRIWLPSLLLSLSNGDNFSKFRMN